MAAFNSILSLCLCNFGNLQSCLKIGMNSVGLRYIRNSVLRNQQFRPGVFPVEASGISNSVLRNQRFRPQKSAVTSWGIPSWGLRYLQFSHQESAALSWGRPSWGLKYQLFSPHQRLTSYSYIYNNQLRPRVSYISILDLKRRHLYLLSVAFFIAFYNIKRTDDGKCCIYLESSWVPGLPVLWSHS
jgi:hypothetical protein